MKKREYPGILVPNFLSHTKDSAKRKAAHYRKDGFKVRIEKMTNQNDPSGFRYRLKIWGGGTKKKRGTK